MFEEKPLIGYYYLNAEVAELADAAALGAVGSNPVGVRISPSAQIIYSNGFLTVGYRAGDL